eukprot:6528032-Prymnesium_polylepis.1
MRARAVGAQDRAVRIERGRQPATRHEAPLARETESERSGDAACPRAHAARARAHAARARAHAGLRAWPGQRANAARAPAAAPAGDPAGDRAVGRQWLLAARGCN